MARNARGGLLVRGVGAASEHKYPTEVEGRDWAHGLGGWKNKGLTRRADRWLKRMGLNVIDLEARRKEGARG
jgi:hypothetical protein